MEKPSKIIGSPALLRSPLNPVPRCHNTHPASLPALLGEETNTPLCWQFSLCPCPQGCHPCLRPQRLRRRKMHKTFCTSAGCWSRPAAQTTPSSTSISPRQPVQTASKRAATSPPTCKVWDTLTCGTLCLTGHPALQEGHADLRHGAASHSMRGNLWTTLTQLQT